MAKMITQIANTATKNLGGQKQLMRSPTAKVIATAPLLGPQRFFIKTPPQVTCTTLYGGKPKGLLFMFILPSFKIF